MKISLSLSPFSLYSQQILANIQLWSWKMFSTTTLKRWWTSCTMEKWTCLQSNYRRSWRLQRCWRSKDLLRCRTQWRSLTASRATTPKEINQLAASSRCGAARNLSSSSSSRSNSNSNTIRFAEHLHHPACLQRPVGNDYAKRRRARVQRTFQLPLSASTTTFKSIISNNSNRSLMVGCSRNIPSSIQLMSLCHHFQWRPMSVAWKWTLVPMVKCSIISKTRMSTISTSHSI